MQETTVEQSELGPFIDLRSDVVSRAPTAMLQAMSKAETGEDVYDDDSTTNRFQSKVADLFGMQSSLYMPSVTMCNVGITRVWTNPGDQIILWANSHFVDRQTSSLPIICGVQTRQIFNQTGIFSAQEISSKIRSSKDNIHYPSTKMIFIQNPTYSGKVWPIDELERLSKFARQKGIKLFCDASRFFNGQKYYQDKYKRQFNYHEITKYYDAMCLCLCKNLCCPMGAVILGSKEVISQVKHVRKALGGGMSQVGIISAAGLYAIQNLIPDSYIDNIMAQQMAVELSKIKAVIIDCSTVQINMVNFNLDMNHIRRCGQKVAHESFKKFLKQQGIIIKSYNQDLNFYRMVIYRQIRNSEVKKFIEAVRKYLHD